jgi:hypothetical protein
MRPRFTRISHPGPVFWVPFITHSYVLVAGLISGVIFEPAMLLIVGLGMALISISLHHSAFPQFLTRKWQSLRT